MADWQVGLIRIEAVLHQMRCGVCRERMHDENQQEMLPSLSSLPPECSVCRGRHGKEIVHAAE